MTPRAATPLESPSATEREGLAKIITVHVMKQSGFWETLPTPTAQNRAVELAWHEAAPIADAILAAGYTRAPSSPLVGELREALGVAKGYMMNAKIDLETGTKKATALATLEGGLRLVESALARARRESE